MSKLNFDKNSFPIDDHTWDSIDAAKLPNKSEENWRYLKWGKLRKINFHGNFKNNLSNLEGLDLPKIEGYLIIIEKNSGNIIKVTDVFSNFKKRTVVIPATL